MQVMAIWPRVSMGRPFLEKFADVQWEIDEEHLQAWKDGRTGFPIVDAAMRACNRRGEAFFRRAILIIPRVDGESRQDGVCLLSGEKSHARLA